MKRTCGVPQGSILRPLLLYMYMLKLAQNTEKNTMSCHNYADDTQLYIMKSPGDSDPIQTLSK